MNWAMNLSSIAEVTQGMEAMYQPKTPQHAVFLLSLTALLHDVGYADLANHKFVDEPIFHLTI